MNYYNVPGRKRATWHNEPEVDPFDVFTCKTVAINDYQKIELEPCRVNSMIWRACNIGGMYKNVQEERKQRAIVSKDKLVEIIEEEFGLNRLVKFEEIMQKGYAKEVVQYLYWARERYEFAVNYIDSISVKYLTDEKDFASMLEEL